MRDALRALARDLLAGAALLTYPVRRALDWFLLPFRVRRADRLRRRVEAVRAMALADLRRQRIRESMALARPHPCDLAAAVREGTRREMEDAAQRAALAAPGDLPSAPVCGDRLSVDYLWGADRGSCSVGDSAPFTRSED